MSHYREIWKGIQDLLGTRTDGIPGPYDEKALNELKLAALAEYRQDRKGSSEPLQGSRHINQDGLDLVKHFEGRYLKAYKDPVGIWTIGYGHTGLQHKDGTVYAGRTITETEAENLLRYDMQQFEKRVETFTQVALDDNQFSALVSFDFNTGGLGKSTLLKKLNAGDIKGAANEFLKWDKAGGKTLAGLTRRRKSERNLFLSQKPYIIT